MTVDYTLRRVWSHARAVRKGEDVHNNIARLYFIAKVGKCPKARSLAGRFHQELQGGTRPREVEQA